MNDTFITKIIIDKVRHLENLTIELSDKARKHLILTGKNGSGKTSVLEALRDYIADRQDKPIGPIHFVTNTGASLITDTGAKLVASPSMVNIKFNREWKDIPFYYFAADHKLKVNKPTAIEKVDLKTSDDILKYIIYLDYLEMRAEKEKNSEEVLRLKNWHDSFIKILKNIFESPNLTLQYFAKDLDVKISIPNQELFGFDEMSDGYSAALRIILDLVAGMENQCQNFVFDAPGIVLIDEIETHLHVELQKKVLPFFSTMFPNIQFIVTTHSPFVITSLSNAVVYDLETQKKLEDLSAYSWESIVEYYYDVDMYSEIIKHEFDEYKSLSAKSNLQPDEGMKFAKLITHLNQIPPAAAPELIFAFKEMEEKRRALHG